MVFLNQILNMDPKYTQSSYFFDYKNEAIQEMITEFKNEKNTQEIITKLYIKIRDGWRYNPFKIGLHKKHYVASHIVKKKEGHCIDKAILYVTGLRALGIPARIHLAKVANHIATERLEAVLGTNELTPHGLVDVYFNNTWVKCSPTFNKELCNKYNVEVLDFDGREDAIFQEYNNDQKKFMSYLEDYGSFADLPYDFIIDNFKTHYPDFYEQFKDADEVIL